MSIARRCSVAGVALAVALLLTAGPALATTYLKTDLQGLTHASEAIVHGEVVKVESAWNAEGTIILSEVTIRVADTVAGVAPSTVTVRVPGGSVGGFTVKMHDGPEFRQGQEVMVFLGRWDDGAYKVTGYQMGLSRVQARPDKQPMLRGGLADGLPLAVFQEQVQGWTSSSRVRR